MDNDQRITTLLKNGIKDVYGDNIPENLTFIDFMKDVRNILNNEEKTND